MSSSTKLQKNHLYQYKTDNFYGISGSTEPLSFFISQADVEDDELAVRNTNLSCVSGSIREEVSLQTVLLKSQKLVSFWRKVCFSLSSNRFRMVEKCRMKAQPVRCLKHRPGGVLPEKSIAQKGWKSERSAQPSLPENPRRRTIVG